MEQWDNMETLVRGSPLRFGLYCPSEQEQLSMADRLGFSVAAKLGKYKPKCANEFK